MRAILITVLATSTMMTAATMAACGGSKPAPRTGGDTGGGGGGDDTVDPDADDPDMVPPDRMDEIKASLDRKRTAAARCFAIVVNGGKVAKNSRGHLSLSFVISPLGKATGVKVLEDSLSSPELEACVIDKVEQIDFGALPQPLDWSYTFAFESM